MRLDWEALLHQGLSVDMCDQEGYSMCWRCVESDNTESLEVLLHFNPNVNLCHKITRQTPLMLACKRANPRIVEKLLHLGASRTQTDSEGNSVVHCAIYGRCLQCLHLVADGENVHRVNNSGQNPMVLAIQEGQTECINYLSRETLNTRFNYEGDHYLSLAARHASAQVLRALLNAGFPIESINDEG